MYKIIIIIIVIIIIIIKMIIKIVIKYFLHIICGMYCFWSYRKYHVIIITQ